MKKKILLATTGLLSVIVLGACSGSSNQDIATMKAVKLPSKIFIMKRKKNNRTKV